MRHIKHVAMFGMLSTAMAACGDGPTSAEPVVRFTADEATATAARGANALVPVVVTQSGGAPGSLRLSVKDLPDGVSASFVRDLIAGSRDSTRLALEVDTLATPGSYDATVLATRDGGEVARMRVRVVIPEPVMDITLSTTFGQVSRTGTLAVTATAVRANGFRGPIMLTIEDSPAGALVVWYASNRPNRQMHTLMPGVPSVNLNATAFQPVHVGLHTVRIRAESPGMPTRIHQLQFQVNDP